MARYSVEGVVLRSINFRDADKIYTIFSKEKGKMSATAKGVRKISSRRGGNLDTLNHVVIGVSENSGGYKTITEAKLINSFKNLKKSLENSVKGFYVAELVYRLMEESAENRRIFDLLISSLKKLDEHLDNELSRVNAFEISLMELLGYEMYLDRCVKCEKGYDVCKSIKFNPSHGGFSCGKCNLPGAEVAKGTADLLFSLKTKKNIKRSLLGDRSAVVEADKLVKMFVKSVLEGDIKTSEIFSGVES